MEVHDPDAEQVNEGLWITAQPYVRSLVDDAAEERHDQRAAGLDEADYPAGGLIADQIEVGDQDQAIARQIVVWPRKIDGHVPAEQRLVIGLDLVHLTNAIGWFGGQLQGPPRVPVEQDGHVGSTLRAADRVEAAELVTKPDDLLPRRRSVDRAVGHHGAVMLLGSRARLPPLEEHHAVGASGDRLVAPQPHLPGGFRYVDVTPVDAVRGLLHQDPGPAATERSHEVTCHRGAHG